jgi:hypothetical protein
MKQNLYIFLKNWFLHNRIPVFFQSNILIEEKSQELGYRKIKTSKRD